LNDPALLQSVIEGTFNDALTAYHDIDLKERPALLPQFEKDMGRGATFKRVDVDAARAIRDATPQPSPQSTKKISDTAYAISELIAKPEDAKWAPILQMAVSQTSLNGAFFGSRIVLTDLGSQVQWHDESGNNFALLPEFPDKLPPVEIEVKRDQNGLIEKVNVCVNGRLDLVKKKLSGKSHDKDDSVNEVIIEGAVRTSLRYTVNAGPNNSAVLSDVECNSETNVDIVKEKF
jgi:hypothetical protein